MQRAILLFAATLLTSAAGLVPAAAQSCEKTQFAGVVDDTGAKLRKQNAEAQPKFLSRLRELGAREGWPESQIEGRAYAFLADDETRGLDEQAASLLSRLDKLADEGPQAAQPCEKLAELKTVSSQLLEVTAAKSSHVSARLDAALRQPAAAAAPQPAQPAPAIEAKPVLKAEPKQETARQDPKAARPALPPVAPPVPLPPPTAAMQPQSGVPQPPPIPPRPSWQTETVRERETAALDPQPMPPLPPRLESDGQHEFTDEDIRAAGRGLFGTMSAELAGVIEYAFRQYGRPNGYILGTEGGGAFLAGLRYGEGRLVTKAAGEQRIFWQGPSLGGDFGVSGSRVMFLVYNLQRMDDMHARFAGIDGSAYFVGGVGITFLKKGPVILAPIRTGLGLRIGANVGYLKFTPTPTLNPF